MNAEQESITEPDAELIALCSRLEGLLQDYFAAHLEWAPGLDDAASARMWALDDEKNPIAEKIMSLPVASIAGLRAKVRKRGKSRGSQAVAQRCLTIAGKYGTSGWFGTARREPR